MTFEEKGTERGSICPLFGQHSAAFEPLQSSFPEWRPAVLYQLNKKTGIRFEIGVQRPPHSKEWSCSLKFKGNDRSTEMNDSLCLILEEFRDECEKLETYWTDQESFDRWIEKELAYYAGAKLQDREVEVLSDLERIQRRNELDRQMMEKMKKAAEENGDQE